MRIVYESQVYDPKYTREDHTTREAAQARIEAVGAGTLVQWRVEPNLSGRLPAEVYRCCALDVYENGRWRNVNIW